MVVIIVLSESSQAVAEISEKPEGISIKIYLYKLLYILTRDVNPSIVIVSAISGLEVPHKT